MCTTFIGPSEDEGFAALDGIVVRPKTAVCCSYSRREENENSDMEAVNGDRLPHQDLLSLVSTVHFIKIAA